MSQRNTHIPQHGRIGQVALQARNRQLRRQVVQYGIGYSEIPLRIFIIDGVHLVRHCRRPHFSRFDFLLEILHRNVLPEVPVEIYHNRVDTAQCIEQSGEIVVIRNLSGPFLPVYPQPLLQKSVPESRPVDIGISKTMSIEITGSSSKLTTHRNRFEQSHLPFQPIAEYPYLFPQTGGRCRLPVSFGKHGNIFPFLGIPVDNSQHIFQHREITIVQSLFQQKRNRRIINIL